ncbi:MAG: FeoA domain-containing protein [Planctomycetota bacterium]|nr:FeoA domain-containing protein [Planctomycetota bacterium]
MVSEHNTSILENHPPAVPLCELREGDCGMVCALHECPHRGRGGRCHKHCCRCEECELLRAMGVTEHCRLRMCRRGRRCIVQVNATRLGISNAIARNILVSPIASKP